MAEQTRETAMAFVDKVVAPGRRCLTSDAEAQALRMIASLKDAEAARGMLAKSGIDVAALDALPGEHARTRLRRIDETKRLAIAASSGVAHCLAGLTPILPADPVNLILDRVTFIRSFADQGAVVDSDIVSLGSWARYRLDSSADAITASDTGRLSFFTLWQNTTGDTATVAAGARLVVNAHLSVEADWNGVAAWFIDGSAARATVRARTTVWAVWNANLSAIVHDEIIGQAGATGGFFGGDDSASLAFNAFLAASGFTVPADEYILIEVELLTEWQAMSGSINLDAESGSFQVSVPHLILTLS